ncbi:MAG: replication initiation factor domain-containing protein [Thalassotalea sp.]
MKSLIDLLKVTFTFSNKELFKIIKSLLSDWLSVIGISISKIKATLKYHKHGVKLFPLDKTTSCCGSIKWDFDKGIIQLDLTGHGCSYVNNDEKKFSAIYALLIQFNGAITEVDIAVDDYSGKFNHRYVQKAYSAGDYDPKRGRGPKRNSKNNYPGSYYIGNNSSVKSVLIYDKLAQMNIPKGLTFINGWTRHEVTLRKKNKHVIPNDVLFNPDAYFVGAYPKIHRRIIKGVEPRNIKREKALTHLNSVVRSAAFTKYQHGRTYNALYKLLNEDSDAVFDLLSRPELSKKHALPSYIDELEFSEYFGVDEDNKKLLISELHEAHYSSILRGRK